ncbi:MAG: hypothetical protein AAFY88_04845 [Acidobacteriota bacterium]
MSAVDFNPSAGAAPAQPANAAFSPNAPVQGFWHHLRAAWARTAPIRNHPLYRAMQVASFGFGINRGYHAIHGLNAGGNDGFHMGGPAGLAGQMVGRAHHIRNLDLQRRGRIETEAHNQRLRDELERDRF